MDAPEAERHIAEYSTGAIRQQYIRKIRHLTSLDMDSAESVYQDVLLNAWRMRDQIQGESFRAYFASIVRRTAINARNDHRKRKEVESWGHEMEDLSQKHPGVRVMAEQVMSYVPEEDRPVLIDWSMSGRGTAPNAQRSHRIRAEAREKFVD